MMVNSSEYLKDHTHNLGSNPRFRPKFFSAFNFTTTLVVCRTTMINQIFISIPSYLFLFLYFFLPLYLSNYFSFFPFFNTAYFIYRSLAPALFFLIWFRRLNSVEAGISNCAVPSDFDIIEGPCQASKLELPIRCLTEQLLPIRRQSP